MTEDEARDILGSRFDVSRETIERLGAFADMVIDENKRQNLIGASTVPQIWVRHILDSAQLASFGHKHGCWLDLGSGAGFPGLVVAIMYEQPITLVESRTKRVAFLTHVVEQLGLDHVRVFAGRLETMPVEQASVITARAFAPLPKLLALAHRFSNAETVWVLPKGQGLHEELDAARESWQGVFHVKQSVTDSAASILVAREIRPKKDES